MGRVRTSAELPPRTPADWHRLPIVGAGKPARFRLTRERAERFVIFAVGLALGTILGAVL